MREDGEFTDGLLKRLDDEREKNKTLLDYVESVSSSAHYCDAILKSRKAIPVTLIAKDYGLAASEFNRLLRGLQIQYKVGGTWALYQHYADKGYTQSVTYEIKGKTDAVVHMCWTQKGRFFLYDILKRYSILPMCERNDQIFWEV
jgi:phage antirepressor YoqD-like protein